MPRQLKTERNREVVRLRDKEKWTFARIGEHFNIKKHTAHEVYFREKARMELSTVSVRD